MSNEYIDTDHHSQQKSINPNDHDKIMTVKRKREINKSDKETRFRVPPNVVIQGQAKHNKRIFSQSSSVSMP